ncbi:hypothetical protein [Gryllotalpicola sp.]|uniref:hypothetical protein n=1 Tax=Gryllotalpicola sp. TaxID=1932787 RepID=UPI00261347CB|nr:hypothetical protein [Gryllotalpicola sp.]
MHEPDDPDLIDARHPARGASPSNASARALSRGEVERIRRGIYLPAGREPEETPRHLTIERAALRQAVAVGLTRKRPAVFSHRTAAIIHGLPLLGPATGLVDIVEPPDSARRSKAGVRVHLAEASDTDVMPWGAHFVTTPRRTALDLARTLPFAAAVAVLDYAIANGLVDRLAILDDAKSLGPVAGVAAARRAIEFADPRAGSPGESASRALLALLGCPPPELQVVHRSPLPGIRHFEVDFEWPELARIGEFDGAGKYLKPEYLKGRSPGEVVVAEKRREDALRAEGAAVFRWGWPELMQPHALRRQLIEAGVPVRFAAPRTLF